MGADSIRPIPGTVDADLCFRGLWRGEHEPEVQNAILAAVRPGAVIHDVGAHVGTVALGAAQLVGDLGRVVAFEGDPENVATFAGL